jgi:hypothetical protein
MLGAECLLQLLGAPAIVRVTDQVFYASLRGPGVVNPATGYGSRSALLRARYCPAFMFVAEGLSRLLLLALLLGRFAPGPPGCPSGDSRGGAAPAGKGRGATVAAIRGGGAGSGGSGRRRARALEAGGMCGEA